jgi:hypothetical protein
MTYLEAFELVGCLTAIILVVKDVVQYVRKYRHERYVEPKLRHREYLLKEAEWLNDRAARLAAFRWELAKMDKPDKFKLEILASKLDRDDWDFAMKHSGDREVTPEDITKLRNWAERKGQECHNNCSQCTLWADEAITRVLSDGIGIVP